MDKMWCKVTWLWPGAPDDLWSHLPDDIGGFCLPSGEIIYRGGERPISTKPVKVAGMQCGYEML